VFQYLRVNDDIHRLVRQRETFQAPLNIQSGIIPSVVPHSGVESDIAATAEDRAKPTFSGTGV